MIPRKKQTPEWTIPFSQSEPCRQVGMQQAASTPCSVQPGKWAKSATVWFIGAAATSARWPGPKLTITVIVMDKVMRVK